MPNLFTAAIDFGTTFSGYAFSSITTPDNIIQNKNWGQSVGSSSYKAPTCVLIDDDDNFIDFGFEAQNRFTSQDEDDSDSDDDDEDDSESDDTENLRKPEKKALHFYDEFKMKLHDKQTKGEGGDDKIRDDTTIYSTAGHPCKAIKIFTMALKYLKNHLIEAMEKFLENKITPSDVKWVLTVPAIWSDSSKHFMRKCAFKAGITESEESDALLIALEPEAASLTCRDLDVSDMNLKVNMPDDHKGVPTDSKYLVIDAGGGTVDITAHHYKKDGDLCELYAASGGAWGGRMINVAFEKIMEEIMGKEVFEKYKHDYAVSYLDVKVKLEKIKRSIDFYSEDYKLSLSAPYSLGNFCTKVLKKPLDKVIKASNYEGVRFSQGNLIFSKAVVDSMFQPTITRIVEHVDMLIDEPELNGIKYVFLVGGFSDCGCLQKMMKEKFIDHPFRIVLAPYEAVTAIMRGAVKFGYNPEAITSRRAKRTYGTDVVMPFDHNKHDASKQINIGGQLYCKDIFSPLVKQNQEVFNDDVIYHYFQPFANGRNSTIFSLYHYKKEKSTDSQSKDRKVLYTNDRGVDKEQVDLSALIKGNKDAKLKIRACLHFGSTELHITAMNENLSTPARVTKAINFICH